MFQSNQAYRADRQRVTGGAASPLDGEGVAGRSDHALAVLVGVCHHRGNQVSIAQSDGEKPGAVHGRCSTCRVRGPDRHLAMNAEFAAMAAIQRNDFLEGRLTPRRA